MEHLVAAPAVCLLPEAGLIHQGRRRLTLPQAVHVLHVKNADALWHHIPHSEGVCFLSVEPIAENLRT